AALFVAGHAQAADTSSTLKINGSVASVCTVSIEDMSQPLNLVAGANKTVVGKVTETCNDPDGYSITFTSQGGGKLMNGKAEVEYTASYDNQNHQNLGSEMRLSRKDAAFGDVNELKVTVKGSDQRVAGNYTDIITVTIAAN
ncbi:MAG: hypothetical protein O3B22_08845, partial [Proteobacteria bacterium]|nr:hypothetical protein [Pseudomonadota bacterium]